MAKNTDQAFESIRIVGGLLGSKVLQDARAYKLPGQSKADYAIEPGLSFNEEMGRYWRIAQGRWKEYQQHIERLDISSHKLAQQEWLLPLLTRVFGYDVEPSQNKVIGEREFPITHFAHNDVVPLVFCGADFDLDKGDVLFGQEGRKRSPMGLAQEYLNAENNCLWAIISNGRYLRLLRDNPAMTRPAYLEVDFSQLFEEDNYADFAMLWLLLQASRLEPINQQVEQCWLEQWRNVGLEEGERILKDLWKPVKESLRQLGTGFVAHANNQSLRDKLSKDELTTEDYFQQVLRLVYRFLFLLTAEDRNVALFPKDYQGNDYTAARRLYEQGYSVSQLRERSRFNRHRDSHSDAWQQLQITFSGFAKGQPLLAQPALGGLFAEDQCIDIDCAEIENRYIYSALFNLSYFQQGHSLSRINYRDMDTEEFGSVYESLLELTPQLSTEDKWQFSFMGDAEDEDSAAGHSRKLTGSYYTPDSLVQELIKSALDPVIADRLQANPQQPREAILSVTVCDPACGSGHFLLAAARRLASRLATIDAGTDQPSEDHYRHAMHDVVRHCIYGVDLNPLAVELCKTGLWLESVEPGKPLSFLNSHIQNGNSLLGITKLDQITMGIPKDAFKALSGDDKQLCKKLSKANSDYLKAIKKELESPEMSLSLESSSTLDELKLLENLPEETVEQIQAKEQAFQEYLEHRHSSRLQQAMDLYLGAFLIPKDNSIPESEIPDSQNLYLALYTDQTPEQLCSTNQQVKIQRANQLCSAYKVFNWPIAFAHIFSGASKGFDCILGNPPWEHVELKEEEFFASRYPLVAEAKNKAERTQRIDWLSQGLLWSHLIGRETEKRESEIRVFKEYIEKKRRLDVLSVFAHLKNTENGRYPLTGIGRVNTYALFSETIFQILSPIGRAGFIVPSGIATDSNTKDFFSTIVNNGNLLSLFEFENEGFFRGAGQGHMLRFALTTLVGGKSVDADAKFLFKGKKTSDILDQEKVFTLSPKDIKRLNPNTLTCPIFHSRYDAELTKSIYRKFKVLCLDNSDVSLDDWAVKFSQGTHNMATDSHVFKTMNELFDSRVEMEEQTVAHDGIKYVPLYESKMIHIYNHRHGDFNLANNDRVHVLPRIPMRDLQNKDYVVTPYYWVPESDVIDLCRKFYWKYDWFISWRRVTDARASARTLIAAAIPRYGVGDSLFIPYLNGVDDARLIAAFLANMNAIVMDYFVRQKLGGLNLNFFTFKQLPFIPMSHFSEVDLEFISCRVVQLSCNSLDMQPFASDLGTEICSFDQEKRVVSQAELDAYFARLYGLTRDELQFVLDPESVKPNYPSETFSVLKRNEEKEFGEYRTQRLVLEAWDKLERGELQ
ncbi:MAG: N-6 DNA methylase [Pseudomonadales bacterium]|nr:N-6 DNA methylase [Pseudomonadales bacterium]